MLQYIPQQGDLVIVSFDPQSGHEQKGRRPAIVVSHKLFNKHTGLAMVCPVTNTNTQHPFHVTLLNQTSIQGYVMVEQIKSVDYSSRKVKFIEKASQAVLHDVLAILDACIYQDQ